MSDDKCVTECPEDTGQDVGSGQCVACADDELTHLDTNLCTSCSSVVHTECNQCYSENDEYKCSRCNDNYVTTANNDGCEAAPCTDPAAPYQSSADPLVCVAECEDFEGVKNGRCTACSIGDCLSCTFGENDLE